MESTAIRSRVRASTNDGWLERVGRLGLVARGLLHGIVAWLALEVAHGHAQQQADSQGALAAVDHQPLGHVLLVGLAVGFLAYAVWSFASVVRTDGSRVGGIARGVIYLVLAGLAVSLVVGSGHGGGAAGAGGGGGSGKEMDLTARVLGWPGGRLIVVAVAIGVIGVGVANAWKIRRRRWAEGLDLERHSPATQRVLTAVSTVGLAARSVVFGMVGIFLIRAALHYDPKEAEGLDGALRRLAGRPHGPALLTIVAIGFIAYGIWCIAMADLRPTSQA